uniref:Uncharacterized protein n=1 Tax=Oryza nivara TaxID=4536 RepID=A0A0E0HWK4_ORYNI
MLAATWQPAVTFNFVTKWKFVGRQAASGGAGGQRRQRLRLSTPGRQGVEVEAAAGGVPGCRGGGGARLGDRWRRRIEKCATRRCGKRVTAIGRRRTRRILPETGGIMHLVPNLRRFGLGVAELERLNYGGDPLHDLNAAMAALESSASAAAAVRASSVSATDCSLHHWPPAARESSIFAADCPLPLAAHRPGKLRHRLVHLRLRCSRLARGCARERENRERHWV